MLTALIDSVEQKKARLDRMRPLSAAALAQLQKHYDVELTYTSNAIEGNILTLRETAEVIEHGITVGGKSLRDHLEAVDHYEAVQWMRELAALTAPIGESTVCELHRRIVARSQPAIAGIYSQLPRRIAGSPAVFPNPAKISQLMEAFGAWLKAAPPDPCCGVRSPFPVDRHSPLRRRQRAHGAALDEYMLIRGGYPPVAVRPEDRKTYLDALERGSLTDDLRPFQIFMHERLDATLREYLSALQEALPQPDATAPQTGQKI